MKFQIPVGRFNYILQKNAPKILMVLGGTLSVGAVVAACKATPKAQDILEETKVELDKIDSTVDAASDNEMVSYNASDAAKDKVIIRSKAAWKLIKAYGPTIILEGAAIGCFFGSHNILNKRNIALSAASLVSEQAFKDYRSRVVERFGEEVDKELRYKMVEKEYQEEVTDSKGKTKVVTKKKLVSEYDGYSEFDRWFAGGVDDKPDTPGWESNPEYNKQYLIQREKWANRDLKKFGYLQLNDVYRMIGFKKTRAADAVGWIYDPKKGDNQISFGLNDMYRNFEFVNGEDPNCYLHFNITTTRIWDYVEPSKDDIAHNVRRYY